jgi:5-hydroxyisourate hydrolase
MAGLSTHVLDTSTGLPAAGVDVSYFAKSGNEMQLIANAQTDADGRVRDLLNGSDLRAGQHRLVFQTGAWLSSQGRTPFYPEVTVDFEVSETDRHHHIPLLLSPFGYSTYRGS